MTGSCTEDSRHVKKLDGTDDIAYRFMINLSSTTGEYGELSGRRSAVVTDSTVNDWFAVLGSGEFLFIPISDLMSVDLRPAAGNPTIEYILMEKAA